MYAIFSEGCLYSLMVLPPTINNPITNAFIFLEASVMISKSKGPYKKRDFFAFFLTKWPLSKMCNKYYMVCHTFDGLTPNKKKIRALQRSIGKMCSRKMLKNVFCYNALRILMSLFENTGFTLTQD